MTSYSELVIPDLNVNECTIPENIEELMQRVVVLLSYFQAPVSARSLHKEYLNHPENTVEKVIQLLELMHRENRVTKYPDTIDHTHTLIGLSKYKCRRLL